MGSQAVCQSAKPGNVKRAVEPDPSVSWSKQAPPQPDEQSPYTFGQGKHATSGQGKHAMSGQGKHATFGQRKHATSRQGKNSTSSKANPHASCSGPFSQFPFASMIPSEKSIRIRRAPCHSTSMLMGALDS